MKTELKTNEPLPFSLLAILAVAAGISVANIYYSQALLSLIREDLAITEFQANLVPMLSQAGYAAGLLFIIPTGDLYPRKRIVLTDIAVLVAALFALAQADCLFTLLASAFLIGICSVIPQVFIPLAAQLATPAQKGRNVGFILSGLLTGILASRVVSGFVGAYAGWRTMYLIAAGLTAGCALLLWRFMPNVAPTFRGTYAGLMRSLFTLVRRFPPLRRSALRAALAFGSFLTVWACLAFKLSGAPFHAGSQAVGLLGLCGIAGALTASTVGRYVPRLGVWRFNLIGCALLLTAWGCLWLGGDSYGGLIAGVIIIDIGMQCIQLSNQSTIFSLCPEASNRLNTIFMTTYFLGGSLGTFLAGLFWQHFAWAGVVGVGVGLTMASLLCNLRGRE